MDLLAVDLRERRVHRRPLGEPLEERGHRELDEAARRAAQRAAPHRVRLPRARLPVRQHRAVESLQHVGEDRVEDAALEDDVDRLVGPAHMVEFEAARAVERDLGLPLDLPQADVLAGRALVGEERADQKRDLDRLRRLGHRLRGHLRGRRGDAIEFALLRLALFCAVSLNLLERLVTEALALALV